MTRESSEHGPQPPPPAAGADRLPVIEQQERPRAEELIERARNASPPGRFSLRGLLIVVLAASVGLAWLRAMGALQSAEDLLALAVTLAFFFAPLWCFAVAAYFNRTRLRHMPAIVGAGVLTAMIYAAAAVRVGGAEAREIVEAMFAGLVLWALQWACLAFVNGFVFRRDRVPRALPPTLPGDEDAQSSSSDVTSEKR